MRTLASCMPVSLHRSFTSWQNLTEFQKSQNWGLRHGGTSRIFLSCAKVQPSAAMQSLGCRLMAGQRILVPSMGVRLPPSQPLHLLHMARSSSGLGRRPLKAEITSSNLVRATMLQIPGLLKEARVFYYNADEFANPVCVIALRFSYPPYGYNRPDN